MLEILRPVGGRISNLILPFVIATSFIATACVRKESVVDNWKLTPPTLELTNARGISLKLRANEVRSAQAYDSNPFIDESAVLHFAPSDRGFPVTFKSRCSSGEIKTEEHTETQITSDRVSVLGLVPPLTLAPENLVKDWQCNLKMQVTNTSGSRSGGELRDLRLNFSALATRLASLNVLPARSDIKRRLICPSWWTGDSDDALDALSRASVVNGVDTREYERQPRCSVLEMGASPKLTGVYRPVFSGARISVTEQKILIPVAEVQDLYRRKLFSWTIKNEERFAQTIFIQAAENSVRFAAIMTWAPPANGITTPVRIFQKFSQSGGLEARQTPAGYYVRLAAGASAVVEMSSNRAPSIASLVDFTRALGTSHLVVTTTIPISVSVLANDSDVKNFPAMPSTELDQLLRDPSTSKTPVLLSGLILEPNRNTGVLAPSKMTPVELAGQKNIGGPDCIEVPLRLDGRFQVID